jgi:cell division initiation protein
MAEAPEREPRKRPSRRKTAVERVRTTRFPVVMRGYDRAAVDSYVADVQQIVAELESNQLRENVVQRALDEVGEQTSSILQRAHETAEEIEVRSRSQAEGRLQRAEREAELTRRDAERYAEELAAETQRLWEDRIRMIEEMRQLADEVLGVADDALERLPEPEALLGGNDDPPEQEFAPVLEESSDDTVAAEVVELPAPAEPDLGSPGSEPPAEEHDGSEPTDESTVEFPSTQQRPQQPPPRD